MQAYFLRYPNPQASHVLTVDVIDRRIEERPSSHAHGMPSLVLCTTRLLLKKGSLPSWAPKNIIEHSTSWVLEDSEVDLTPRHDNAPRVMSIWTRNLDHTSVMAITEGLKFEETSTAPAPLTRCEAAADVRSEISFKLLRGRIEKFGLKRYISHLDTSRDGLIWTIRRLLHLQNALPEILPTRRQRLLNAMRPPFLDGYPLSPWQWTKKKWAKLRERFRSVSEPTPMEDQRM